MQSQSGSGRIPGNKTRFTKTFAKASSLILLDLVRLPAKSPVNASSLTPCFLMPVGFFLTSIQKLGRRNRGIDSFRTNGLVIQA